MLYSFDRFVATILYREEIKGSFQYTIGYIDCSSSDTEYISLHSFSSSLSFQGIEFYNLYHSLDVTILDGPTILLWESNKRFYCGRLDDRTRYQSGTITLPNEFQRILFCGSLKGVDIAPSYNCIVFSSQYEITSSKNLKTQELTSLSETTRKYSFYQLPIDDKTISEANAESAVRWNLIPGNIIFHW